MKNYCIDYRNGSMGNTILSHILFATDQVVIDLENFFSCTGDAHLIGKLNRSNLKALHLIEFPTTKYECILQIICQSWDEILRLKMSYSKWMKAVPNLTNYQNFFDPVIINDDRSLWECFYNDIKDPSWPECPSASLIPNLPQFIQDEIKKEWKESKNSIKTDYELVEFLTIVYYDSFVRPKEMSCPYHYQLKQYLKGDLSGLIQVSKKMRWDWDESRSTQFYQKMLQMNQKHLFWLSNLKKNYDCAINTKFLNCNLELWEVSVLLAKIFTDIGRDPRDAKWQNLDCYFATKSLKLNQLIGI